MLRRSIKWLFGPAPPTKQIEDFERWVDSALRITYSREGPGAPTAEETEMLAAAFGDPNGVVDVEGDVDDLPLLQTARCQFAALRLHSRQRAPCVLTGLKIQRLELRGVPQLTVVDCQIGTLALVVGHVPLKLRNVWINVVGVPHDCGLQSPTWIGGYLGKASFHSTARISGDFLFRDVHVSRNRERHGVQWLRDVRAILNAKHDFRNAGVFHAVELALSRRDEPFSARCVSYVYEVGSEYGNSIGRAGMWLLVLMLCVFNIAFLGGTAASAGLEAVGWHGSLSGDGLTAQVLRACVYAFNSVFNPLNLIVSKPLVSALSWPGALVASVLGLLGTIAFAMVILSIRRRFRLE